ncbi:MAG TPA: glycosyltransferase family 4 protein, partial [Pyrinomonadaceae bacterium]|nr:glycosyltransferase family 4 protein [Pyrinomonadaceae bacterium]
GRDTHGYRAVVSRRVSELGLDDKVEWLGHVEGDEKQQLIADAFWTVMPSHTENFGIVVLESLAHNTPVIASKGSPWETLETERLGFWVDNSPEELSKVVSRVIRMDETEYAAYRQRGREFVEQNFDIVNNIGTWTEIYRNLR